MSEYDREIGDGDEDGLITIRTGFCNAEQPKYGEEIHLGVIDGQEVSVTRPLNREAKNESGPLTIVAIALHDRIAALEKKLSEQG